MSTLDGFAAIGRDPDAFESLYRAHLEAVQRFVARRVDTPEDAADSTAEVFLAAIKASQTYRGEAPPRAWLYGIARHVVANHHRSRARALRATQRSAARELLDEDTTARIAARIDTERQARHLYQSLAALPERQRSVIELVAVDDLSLIEAASALDISAGNARVRYHRARQRLTQDLTRPSIDPEQVIS